MIARWFCANRLRTPPVAALLVAVALNPNAFGQMMAREFETLPIEEG